jgi:hypothetical protein
LPYSLQPKFAEVSESKDKVVFRAPDTLLQDENPCKPIPLTDRDTLIGTAVGTAGQFLCNEKELMTFKDYFL